MDGLRNAAEITAELRLSRDRQVIGLRLANLGAFVVAEEESRILLDRTAEGKAILVALEGRLLARVEEVLGVERVVAQELKDRAVKIVGAGLDRNVDGPAERAAGFRPVSVSGNLGIARAMATRLSRSTGLSGAPAIARLSFGPT